MALQQWQAGEKRLADAPAPERPAWIGAEGSILGHRRGGFGSWADGGGPLESSGRLTVDALADRLDGGPDALSVRTVADAACARYLRGAVDFAGGRRLEVQP